MKKKSRTKRRASPKKHLRITAAQVIASLTSPRAPPITKLGAAALPYLKKLVEGDNMLLATKALYAAGVVGGDDAAEIIRYGAKSRKPLLRVVSAAAAESLSPEMAESVLKPLLKSRDAGIKKWAKHTTKNQNALRTRSAKAPRAAP